MSYNLRIIQEYFQPKIGKKLSQSILYYWEGIIFHQLRY